MPLLYRWLLAHGFKSLTPWHFMDQDAHKSHIESRRREYSIEVGGERDIWPFAERQDMDTIAGFVVENGKITDDVITVHLTWSRKKELPGWPSETAATPFQTWLAEILVADAAEWMSEEDLVDIQNEGP